MQKLSPDFFFERDHLTPTVKDAETTGINLMLRAHESTGLRREQEAIIPSPSGISCLYKPSSHCPVGQ